MGVDLCLYTGNEKGVDKELINKYYHFMKGKEEKYQPESIDYDAYNFRDRDIETLEKNERVFICERWLSDLNEANINLDDLFGRESDIIFGEDIKTLINRLEDGKDRLKEKEHEKADFWEYYFEMRLIALCEFAYKNNYGVEISV